MDWIKVKVRHAEYDFSGAPDNVFRTWIMVMIFVAATECKPLREHLCNRYGKNNVNDLENWLAKNNVKLDTIFDKVLEDVEAINKRKSHNRKYMQDYRCKDLRNDLRGVHVKGKRREEKIREECVSSIGTHTQFLTPDELNELKQKLEFKHLDIDAELKKRQDKFPNATVSKAGLISWLKNCPKPAPPVSQPAVSTQRGQPCIICGAENGPLCRECREKRETRETFKKPEVKNG